tara:strand:+ start:243 stop:1550 length:1308 start_codon:yes stop_codon:yes gene_type:complete
VKKFNLEKIFDRLYPINRSIIGKGYDKSLEILSEYINFKIDKYPSGKKIFDWVVPKEWLIEDAYIKQNGKKVLDFKNNNLHVVNYSAPINKRMGLKELKKNIYTIKKNPTFIPYVTSYYKKNWGFCISYNNFKKFKNLNYNVFIKSAFKNGFLKNGISEIKGRSKKTVLLSSYLCHPSMANNELSGPLVLLGLQERIKKWKNKNFSYIFLINPETIGSLCFIYTYKKFLKKYLKSGLILTCLGGYKKKLSYKLSRFNNSDLDRLFIYYSKKGIYGIRKFDSSEGSDERQYCSGEQNLPVGQIARTVYGKYKEYHTSADDKKFMNLNNVEKSINLIEKILKVHEMIFALERFEKNCELQLGKKNLYPNVNSFNTKNYSSDILLDNKKQLNMLTNILAYADGKHDILDIINIFNYNIDEAISILDLCLKNKLIKYPN